MTREDKIKAYVMCLDGATLQEAADRFGVTREYIRQIFNPRKRAPKEFSCIYPWLKNWIIEHGYSCPMFQDACGLPFSYNALLQKCKGMSDFTMREIKMILAFTGMTFEEAFGKEDRPGGESNGCEQQTEGREI